MQMRSYVNTSGVPFGVRVQSSVALGRPKRLLYCFGVRWPRLFLLFASRVRPSTPPLSQRVLRHLLEAQRVGCSTDGIQTCPQTSHTATFCIRQPMVEIIHNDQSAEYA